MACQGYHPKPLGYAMGVKVAQTMGERSAQMQMDTQHNVASAANSEGSTLNKTSITKQMVRGASPQTFCKYAKVDSSLSVTIADQIYVRAGEDMYTFHLNQKNQLLVTNEDTEIRARQKITKGLYGNDFIEFFRDYTPSMLDFLEAYQNLYKSSGIDLPIYNYETVVNAHFKNAKAINDDGSLSGDIEDKSALYQQNKQHISCTQDYLTL